MEVSGYRVAYFAISLKMVQNLILIPLRLL